MPHLSEQSRRAAVLAVLSALAKRASTTEEYQQWLTLLHVPDLVSVVFEAALWQPPLAIGVMGMSGSSVADPLDATDYDSLPLPSRNPSPVWGGPSGSLHASAHSNSTGARESASRSTLARERTHNSAPAEASGQAVSPEQLANALQYLLTRGGYVVVVFGTGRVLWLLLLRSLWP